jgi:DNA-binding GntR family transcriptional regulator
VLPAAVTAHTANRREQIYPEVEHAVAVCLAHGRFRLNETALAQHYDVSRTIAHEVLTQLERAGIIEQDSNNRWYAGPLSAAEFEHHYEMRWLLEPQALRQAFSFLDKSEVAARLRRLRNAASTPMQPPMLERLEADLHIDTLASCPNDILLNAVRRSQRVLIATHSTFAAYRTKEDISLMAMEHGAIYEALLDHDIEHATTVLEAHLRRALYPNLEVLRQLAPLPAGLRQPYLLEVK